MKYTLLITALLMIGCKKEDPAPPPSTGTTNSQNVFTVGSQTYTIQGGDTAYHSLSNNLTEMFAIQGGNVLGLAFIGDSAGTYHYLYGQPYLINVVVIDSVGYRADEITINVTDFPPAGQKIRGNFSGTFKKTYDTTVVIQASGDFAITRFPDIQ